MSTPPSYRTKESQAAFEWVYERDPFCIPQLIEKIEKKEPTPSWVVDELERAFLIGFMQGKKAANGN